MIKACNPGLSVSQCVDGLDIRQIKGIIQQVTLQMLHDHYVPVLYLLVSPELQKDDGLFIRPGDLLSVFLNAHSRL